MKNKRFIAGAVCPACGAMDKIFTYENAGSKWRACVACELNEPFKEQESVSELETRVNQHRLGEKPLAHEVPVEKVTLIDEKKS